jgi:hypothetical protein
MIIIATNENQYSTDLTLPKSASSINFLLHEKPGQRRCPGSGSDSSFFHGFYPGK